VTAFRRWAARQLRHLEHRLEPLPRPSPVVVDGYAQGRADLQLVHGHRATPNSWHATDTQGEA
jgi:hypothetical protein